jgi:hypothetical protein
MILLGFSRARIYCGPQVITRRTDRVVQRGFTLRLGRARAVSEGKDSQRLERPYSNLTELD